MATGRMITLRAGLCRCWGRKARCGRILHVSFVNVAKLIFFVKSKFKIILFASGLHIVSLGILCSVLLSRYSSRRLEATDSGRPNTSKEWSLGV